MRRWAAVTRALACALGLGAGSACGGRPIAPPPAAPVVDEPGLLVPADLDLVLRLDLARWRAVLGLEGSALLEQLARRAPVDEPDRETAQLALSWLARADTAWIGVRPGLAPELTDSVVVLRGNFRDLVPSRLGGAPAWSRPMDLGGSVLRFERTAPKLRAAPAVIYLRGADLAVIGSEAEVDALELGFSGGREDSNLRVPESGLIALAARLEPLRRKLSARAPLLSRLLEGADALEASLDRDGDRFRVRMELAFATSGQARDVATALASLSERLSAVGREWFSRVQVDALERALALRLELSDRELYAAIHCWQSADC